MHLTAPERRAPKVFVRVSSSEVSVAAHCKLHFTPDNGAEVTAIGLRQLHLLGLSEGNLSRCQEVVMTAGKKRLNNAGKFRSTLTLGTAVVDTNIN
ncbi:hypothetical protein E2C01_070894 [Portunus trituberculatus]|uniref:Uncharacterized protein n=1 Tax=Portunus trituberculatus TaxID=210409 RepID=A0A5B7HVG0_PORTR|nr:hypothetical protein [Portunus trituberculatus]